MIRRFELARGCSSKKNIHRLVVVLEKFLLEIGIIRCFFLYGRALKSITLVKLTSILEIRIEIEQKFFIYAI